MTTNATQTSPPGWYRDPSGTGQRRWWNGLAWTNYMDDDLVLQGVVSAPVLQPMIPSTTSLNPWPIWAVALLPLASLAPLLLIDYDAILRGVFQAVLAGASARSISLGLLPLNLLDYAVGLAVFLATVAAAGVDWWILKRRIGVVKPFHWAWTILSPLVYLIGRAIVLKRRSGQNARGPVWLYVLVSLVIAFAPAVKITASLSVVIPEFMHELQQQEQRQLDGPNSIQDA